MNIMKFRQIVLAAALFGFAAAAWVIADGLTRADLGSSLLPLTDMGMGFLIPALIGAAAGALFKGGKKDRSGQEV